MDQALNQKIDAYIAENKEQLLQDIAALVAIDSVEGTPEEGAPFGAGPRAALDTVSYTHLTALQAAGGVLRWTHLLQPEECTRRAAVAYRKSTRRREGRNE